MLNVKKLLNLAVELHKKGFTGLQVIPSLSPSGVYWRCDFVNTDAKDSISVSNWLQEHFNIRKQEISVADIVTRFQKDYQDFLSGSRSTDITYCQWFSHALKQLEADELPYAFSDYYDDPNFWQTSKGQKIKTLN